MIELIFALVIALLLAVLFIPWTAPEREAERTSAAAVLLFFFLILFLATWAGGVWIRPVGPPLWGASWMSFVLVGFFVAMLLAAATEPSRRRYIRSRGKLVPVRNPEAEEETAEAVATAFGLLFWVLILGLIAAIVISYVAQ
jgi:hypothetical protein